MTIGTQWHQATWPRKHLCPYGPETSLPHPGTSWQAQDTGNPIHHKRCLAMDASLTWWPWESPLFSGDITAVGEYQYRQFSTTCTLCLHGYEKSLLHIEALGILAWGTPESSGSSIRDHWECQPHQLTKQIIITLQRLWL